MYKLHCINVILCVLFHLKLVFISIKAYLSTIGINYYIVFIQKEKANYNTHRHPFCKISKIFSLSLYSFQTFPLRDFNCKSSRQAYHLRGFLKCLPGIPEICKNLSGSPQGQNCCHDNNMSLFDFIIPISLSVTNQCTSLL